MTRNRKAFFLFLFFLSGSAGLIYEIVWSRQLVLVFGGTTYAVTTVLACFMGGLALGGYLGGRLSLRIGRHILAYGVLEVLIGLYCIFTPRMFGLATPLYSALVTGFGESFALLTSARVVVSALILLLPTTFMGATLPLLVRAFAGDKGQIGGDSGKLYGTNTMGAFLGTVAAGFFLIPYIGLSRSIWLAAALNATAGVAAIALSRVRPGPAPLPAQPSPTLPDAGPWANRNLVLILYALSGFAAMAYQVAWTRALIMSMGSSVYAFSSIVACFILGIGAGSLFASTRADRLKKPLLAAGVLEAAIALGALAVVPLFGRMPLLVNKLTTSPDASFWWVLFVEVLCVFGLLIVPTLCMGALLPIICRLYDPRPEASGRSVGNVYAFNTAGTIFGALAAGFLLIPSPSLGVQRTIILASILNGAVATGFLLLARDIRRPLVAGALCAFWAVGSLFAVFTSPWPKKVMVSGPFLGRLNDHQRELIYYREGTDATVAVTMTQMARSLHINGKADASSSWDDLATQYMLGLIPMLLKSDAKDVAVIGLGVGGSATAVLSFPVERVDIAEISDSVIEASKYFGQINDFTLSDKRAHVHRADGRNFLLLTDRKYDIVTSEPSNLWVSGMVNLFTRDFFEVVKSRLKPGGMHCQWLHGYSMSGGDFASIIRTFMDSFRYVQLWELSLGDYQLIGSMEPIVLDVESLYLNFAGPETSRLLNRIYMNDPVQMASMYISDYDSLAPLVSDSPILTDDLPFIEFTSPRNLVRYDVLETDWIVTGSRSAPELSGGADNPLNAYFLDEFARSKAARLHISDAVKSFGDLKLKPLLGHLTEISRLGSNDPRAVSFLFEKRPISQDPEQAELIAQTYREQIYPHAPLLDELVNSIHGQQADLYWPFSPNVRTNAENRDVLSGIDRLSASGRRGRALEKAKAALPQHPFDLELLRRASALSFEVEGPEAAVPYLLRAWVMDQAPDTSYMLAVSYAKRGDRKNSLNMLRRSVLGGLRGHAKITSEPAFDFLRDDVLFRELYERLLKGSGG